MSSYRPRHRRARRRPTRSLAVLTIGTVLATGGIAQAYWSGTGSGFAHGTTGAQLALTLSPGTPDADLYPGGRTDVRLLLSNPNDSALDVRSLALDSGQGTDGFAVDADHSGCGLASLHFTTQTNAAAGWTVPGSDAGVDGTLAVSLTNALAMSVDADNACQGGQFTVYLAAGS